MMKPIKDVGADEAFGIHHWWVYDTEGERDSQGPFETEKEAQERADELNKGSVL